MPLYTIVAVPDLLVCKLWVLKSTMLKARRLEKFLMSNYSVMNKNVNELDYDNLIIHSGIWIS